MACDSSEEVRLKYEHVDTVIPVPLEVEEKSADSEGKVGTNNTSSCNVMTAGNGKENQTAQGLRARGSNSELTVDLTKTAAVSHGQRTSSEISDSRDKEQRPLGEAGPPSGTYSSPRACSHSSSLKGICSGHLTSSEGAKREDVITGHLQTTCKTLYQRDNQSAIRQAEKFDLSNWESWERSPIKDLEDFVMARSSVIQVNEHYKLQAHGNLEPKVNAEIRAPATGPSSTKSQTDHQSLGLWPAGSSRGQHPVAGESKDAFARSPRAHRPSRNITQGSNTHYQIDSFYTTARLRDHSVTDIDRTLKEVDGATSLQHLHLLRSKCRRMLPSFISTFEGCQCVDFKDAFVSRDLVIERDLGGGASAAPVVLKYRALDSFLELQMMMEAVQFVENKISFLSGDPTFRSLLWSDPTLRRELLEGKEGDRQQPSLFPAFQERLAQRGDNKRRKRHSRPSSPTFSQAKETSYYLYLKNEREKAESQAVLEQCLNREAFSLSTPLSSCINFGDCIEDLELLQKNIVSFMEAQPSQPRGGRDFGKVEQLGVVRRLLQEKISYLRSNKEVDARISWFGLEHILLDAAKTMAWEDLREHRGSGPSDPGKDETRHVINEAATRRLHRLYEKILPGCESETPPCSRAPPRDPHLVTDMQNKEASMEGPIEKDSLSNKERNEDQIRTNKLPEIHQSAATKNSTALPCPVERPESQQVRSHLEAPDLPDRRLSFQQNIQIQALGLRSLMAMHSSHFDAEKEVTETPAAARPVRSSPAVARCPPPKRQSRKPNSRKIRTPASNSVPVPSDVALGPQHKLWRPLPSSQSFTLLPSVLAVGRQGGQGQQPLQKPQPQPLAAVWGSTEARQSRPPWTHPDTQLGSPGIPGPGVPAAPWNGQLQILSAPAQGYWNHAVLPYWSQYQGSTAWTQQLPGAVFSTGRPEPQAEATSYPAFPSTTSSCFYHPQALNCSCPYYTVDSYYLCNEYTYAMDNSPLPAVGNRPLSRFYSDASYSGTGLTPAGKPLKRRLL
ncbi:uncharacterized protein LOC136755104 [Amia ocellicauda]|uniref:uncharacterized protein LOC136755104 n=1 Tax=Amia ocellicauda TaxID=2972642 RepID=UPI003463E936